MQYSRNKSTNAMMYFSVLLMLFILHQCNIVFVQGFNLPSGMRKYNERRHSINEKAMEDALASVGMDERSASTLFGDSRTSKLLRFSKTKGVGFQNFGLEWGGKCFGLGKLCDNPCNPEETNCAGTDCCDAIKSSCLNHFCSPLCLRTTFECAVEGVSHPFAELNQQATSDALCTILKASLCKAEGCCNDDDKLQNYVEAATEGGLFPQKPVLIRACDHDPAANPSTDLCSSCKKAIAGKMKTKTFASKPGVCNTLDAYVSGHGKDPDCTKGEGTWCPNNYNYGFPGIPDFHSMKSMCSALDKNMDGALAGATADFEAGAACHCLGCCDDFSKCPFSIVNIIRL
jgi:hypothetical protein